MTSEADYISKAFAFMYGPYMPFITLVKKRQMCKQEKQETSDQRKRKQPRQQATMHTCVRERARMHAHKVQSGSRAEAAEQRKG